MPVFPGCQAGSYRRPAKASWRCTTPTNKLDAVVWDSNPRTTQYRSQHHCTALVCAHHSTTLATAAGNLNPVVFGSQPYRAGVVASPARTS